MVLTKRDKIGLVVLVAMFVFLFIAMWWTFRRPYGPTRDMSESVLVKQRMAIIENRK